MVDDRIRSSVDAAVAELSTRLSHDTRGLVDQVLAIAQQEHAERLATVRVEVAAETERLVRAEVTADTDRLVGEAAARAQATERETNATALVRLVEGIRGLDGASSLSEVLDVLGYAASREASRAAVLVVRQDRLNGWKLSGFGPCDAQPKAIDIGLTDGSLLSAAVSTAHRAITRDARNALEPPPFAELPANEVGLATPVIVGGRVVAVVYADSGATNGQDDPAMRWPDAVEVLARHAGRCLEALTVQRATTAASPRFWMQAVRPGTTSPIASATEPLIPAAQADRRATTISGHGT